LSENQASNITTIFQQERNYNDWKNH